MFNEDSEQSIKEQIILPESYSRATCIRNGRPATIENHALTVEVEPDDAAVYRLE